MRAFVTYRGERWRIDTSGQDREAAGIRSVGAWFTNDETGEQIHGDLNPGIIDAPSHGELVEALDVTLCTHMGLTAAATAAGVQDRDVVAARRSDGRYDVRQRIRGSEHFLEGPVSAADAERRAIELASREQGDACIQEGSNSFRILT